MITDQKGNGIIKSTTFSLADGLEVGSNKSYLVSSMVPDDNFACATIYPDTVMV